MPELPEAETIARQLDALLKGRRLTQVVHVREDMVSGVPDGLAGLDEILGGTTVVAVGRRGKRVILRLAPTGQLIVRLGMTGRLQVQRAADPVETHTHLRIAIEDGEFELRFRDPRRFGGIQYIEDGAGKDATLGIEPLEMTRIEFRRLMEKRRQIKALLMDQSVIAGLGNIYCDESLFAARIHPLTRADTLSLKSVDRLRNAIQSTLRRAIKHKGSTLMDYRDASGEPGGFQLRHRVYQREGEKCRTCGTLIKRIIAAGRSTFFCPKCQRPPRRRKTYAIGSPR
ncbi:MAG: bifunctional DNA-formamidopyrimidine glycosylase/DNA-(apurinic or apyrimidinic site) lyase [Planctomycetes bacterium]|nr:bifunctional DNA-formamidopyrimidine glycosylase/DNA-(apurinic or apyrimidinic site) lyase [Planctomycetota bacterium]MBI3833901.1 bifunctional DNA-formamidopyrimidine glycosylase/DNA-(apurinic or apyrimidinic site) lyase [Planctomycetota bacterium]